MKRATVYFEEDLHKALKMKAIESESSLSDIVNQAIRYTLEEDLDDLEAIEARKGEGEISYEAFLKELKSRGQI
jgi:metal-responsive CopG/Arc/MetJ family transcriptional regulator